MMKVDNPAYSRLPPVASPRSVRTYGKSRTSSVCNEAPSRVRVSAPASVLMRSNRPSKKKKPWLVLGRRNPLRVNCDRRPGTASTDCESWAKCTYSPSSRKSTEGSYRNAPRANPAPTTSLWMAHALLGLPTTAAYGCVRSGSESRQY